MAAQVVAVKQVGRLGPGEYSSFPVYLGRGQTIDVMLGDTIVPALPGLPIVFTDVDRVLGDSGDYRAAVRFDDNGVNVFVRQCPAGDAPSRTADVPLQEYDPFFSSDQHLLRARSRGKNSVSAMR